MCLNVLNLSGNRILSLPTGLHRMSSLHTLDVDRNPLTHPPTNVSFKVIIFVFTKVNVVITGGYIVFACFVCLFVCLCT